MIGRPISVPGGLAGPSAAPISITVQARFEIAAAWINELVWSVLDVRSAINSPFETGFACRHRNGADLVRCALISSPGDPSWFVGEDRRDLTVVIEMSERLR